MLNEKNNWYHNSQSSPDLVQEAALKDWKNLVWAVALIFSGLSVYEVSQKTGLETTQIEQALETKEIVDTVKGNQNETVQPVQAPVQQIEEKVKSPSALDFGAIEEMLRLHEVSGVKRMVTVNGEQIDIRKVYPDPIYGMRVPTIGVGYNLNRSEARSEIEALGLDYDMVRDGRQILSDDQVNELYRNDIGKSIAIARKFIDNFDQLPTDAKTILVDMAFNLGETRLRKFKKMKMALEENNFKEASEQMKDSKWYGQVGERAKRLVEMMNNVQPIPQEAQEEEPPPLPQDLIL
jgi:GH24 family phage-related lysozyme (muramidase)